MSNENIRLYGHATLPPQPIQLRAGALDMIFEPDNAFLRYVKLGNHEVVRNVYAVVRDQNWNTIPWKVTNLHVAQRDDSFDITFDVDCDDGQVRYGWRGAISGSADSRISFSFDGEARSDFLRNRIGICVLHPMDCAGKPCRVVHTDGSTEQTGFPREIAPWQPFHDVGAIIHPVLPGVEAEVRFEGEVFETEDQRNFSDASFKTYSTPQDLPKPVQVRSGDRVKQRVTVAVPNAGTASLPQRVSSRITISGQPRPKPAIGLQLNRDGQSLTPGEVNRIRALNLTHVRADISLAAADWTERLVSSNTEAAAIGVPLQLGVHLGTDLEAELARLVAAVQETKPNVQLWLVHRRGEGFASIATITTVREAFQKAGIPGRIAAAASPFFIEMNRSRLPADSGALLSFPFTPQVHLTDRFTLIENLADVTPMIDSAAAMSSSEIVVSPITLRRAEPKPSVQAALSPGDLPATVDPRQLSLFAAGWTIGHYSHLAVASRLHSATYFETNGWRGVMESAAGSPLPDKFPSIPGAVFPIYHAFADIADFTKVIETRSSSPLHVQAITLSDGADRRALLIANLLAVDRVIQIEGPDRPARLRRLNASNAEEAMRNPEHFRSQPGAPITTATPLTLAPHEYIRLDWSDR